MGRTERAERDTPVSAHAPTWELKLGKYGTGYGDLEKDGFEARNSNATSGQDAFAVSADRKRFAVTDGLGGAADTEGTAFLARYFADVAVQRGVDTVLNPDSLKALYREAEDAFAAQTGRRFARSTIARKEAGSAVTTLTYAEVIDSTHVRIVTIGDSPAFLLGSDRRRVRQYGEDALSGHTDKRLAFKLGIDEQGKPMAIDTTDMRIVNKIIEVPEGHSVAIGTDYFSDFAAARGDFNDFIGQTPEVFHDRSRRSGSKPDDATLITIDPARLALAS